MHELKISRSLFAILSFKCYENQKENWNGSVLVVAVRGITVEIIMHGDIGLIFERINLTFDQNWDNQVGSQKGWIWLWDQQKKRKEKKRKFSKLKTI